MLRCHLNPNYWLPGSDDSFDGALDRHGYDTGRLPNVIQPQLSIQNWTGELTFPTCDEFDNGALPLGMRESILFVFINI